MNCWFLVFMLQHVPFGIGAITRWDNFAKCSWRKAGSLVDEEDIEIGLELIRQAIHGKKEAVERILLQYDPYINRLSTVYSHTTQGAETSYIDEDIKVQLSEALVSALRRFDLEGIIHGTRILSHRASTHNGKRRTENDDANSDESV